MVDSNKNKLSAEVLPQVLELTLANTLIKNLNSKENMRKVRRNQERRQREFRKWQSLVITHQPLIMNNTKMKRLLECYQLSLLNDFNLNIKYKPRWSFISWDHKLEHFQIRVSVQR